MNWKMKKMTEEVESPWKGSGWLHGKGWGCYGLNGVLLPHSNIEALMLNVTIFGDKTFKEVIKVNKVMGVGP